MLDITRGGKVLENTSYLNVTCDRTLSYRTHIEKLCKKLSTCNSLLAALANSSWGAKAQTLCLSTLVLCFSVIEYCIAAWACSADTAKVDVELNKVCTISSNWLSV